jgi:hypothetical protein
MISWLTGKAALYACGALLAVIIGLGFWIAGQKASLGICHAGLELAESRIKTLEEDKKRLSLLIEEQNQAVDKLKSVATEKAALADQALADARKAHERTADSQKRIAALLGASTPSGAGCKEGVAAVRKELK